MPDQRGEGEQEHVAVYQRFRRVFGDGSVRTRDARRRARRQEGSSVPFAAGRDPRGIGEVMDALTASLGWTSPLARSELISSWDSIVGSDLAEHADPIAIEEGTLTVRCDSTAWATQLRLIRVDILSRIAQSFPDAGIQEVRFLGPDTPSWKRGPRSIQGRGPRDTYG
ncbi:DciA family protein [Salinibacterium sp. SYSU T00001]|uniref:DUF721 domain-containing protein n=1 Tax=Homoserinimonas sedimenticola TaxID=2986805 RepID=UPI0022356417|nr:DciA family protein [Salinibacterium sedimenticola]MCW4385811.1 DciA family protein [Salinibacterium sedimenticola]